jgi:hypothetical protein
MQLTNSPGDDKFPAVESAMHPLRLKRYMPAAGQDTKVAFKYYLWNCSLCESFHLSLHFAEIVCRNTLHAGLTARLNENWYNNSTFRTILDPKFSAQLNDAYTQEAYQHGTHLTSHHMFRPFHSDFGSIWRRNDLSDSFGRRAFRMFSNMRRRIKPTPIYTP